MDHRAREGPGPGRSWGDHVYPCMAGLLLLSIITDTRVQGSHLGVRGFACQHIPQGCLSPPRKCLRRGPWQEKTGEKPVLRGPRCFVSSFGFEPNWAEHVFLKQPCSVTSPCLSFPAAHFLCLVWFFPLVNSPPHHACPSCMNDLGTNSVSTPFAQDCFPSRGPPLP